MRTLFCRLADSLGPHYRLLRPLGTGGAAHVFVAKDLRCGRRVAIKVLREELAATLSAERFLAEITTTSELRHPNIVPLLDWGTADGVPYYVMPLVDGESLREHLNRVGLVSLGETVHIVAQVGAALDFAHQRRVIHRDIKPENVILGSGRALVLDFGIALALDPIDRPRWTLPGWMPGTPEYMSPEQANGDAAIDGRSDVYSLGCVAYEMLAGRPPFTGPFGCVLYHHVSTEATPLVSRCPGTPVGVSTSVARALAKAPDDRFATCGGLVRALRAAIFGVATVDPGGVPAMATDRLLFSRP